MALLVAIALFVAQAINFGLLLRERRQLRFEQITSPAVTRMADAVERTRSRPDFAFDRGPVRLEPHNPIAPRMQPAPDVEDALRETLTEAGVALPRIEAAVHVIDGRNVRIETIRPRHTARIIRRVGAELLIAVEVPGRGWLVQHAPWPRGGDASIIWRLIGQTLILYAIVLIPVLWVGRRISRPLRSLASAARDFTPGNGETPLDERGPGDVRDVIAAFNALRLRVNAMLDEKDRMLGAIGHDLRTPLAALRVRIESVEDDADRQKMAETIAEMNRTLDDILSLARLGRPSEPPTEVDLTALVDAVVEDFRDLGDDVAFAESDRLTMRLRPSLMRRAVRNLIENAIKYGGGAEVRIDRDAAEVRIVVADRGPGIPEDRLADVFDPFTRLETSRNRETGGIGLGLALARAIVREAGGDIRLANRNGSGLDAVIALPVRG
ncbi:MAG TPA: HAMP domain-containing sensor histidine kinase [Sphingomonas sp.]|nr:HAMP domain-containing sensor histidine kinase [Sphingomonas sp.]